MYQVARRTCRLSGDRVQSLGSECRLKARIVHLDSIDKELLKITRVDIRCLRQGRKSQMNRVVAKCPV